MRTPTIYGVTYINIPPYTRTYVDMTCRASALACQQEDESPYLPSEKAKSNTAAANYKVVSELERHTVASACTETLTLMDVNVACITETLNILVANISGFTVMDTLGRIILSIIERLSSFRGIATI